MKTLKFILCISIIVMFSGDLAAQKQYQSLSDEEGIEFSYRWKPSRILKKESPLMLSLKIRNSNDFHASVNFTVDYFWQGIRNASSEPNRLCIKANRTARGRIRNLTFDRAKFSDEDIMSDNFTLDISGIEVTQVERCRKKIKVTF